MEHKNYYSELPENYAEDYVIDAKNKKTIIIMNIAATVISIALVAGSFLISVSKGLRFQGYTGLIVPALIFLVSNIAYVVMHELLHGLAYKIFTGEKLAFGVSLTVAFCGVPSLYIKKKAALIAVLTPFVVFSVAFGVPLFFISDPMAFLVVALLFSVHVSGCVGDLFGAFLLIFRYKGKDVLVNDTGPRQTYYLPSEQRKAA